MADTKIAQVAPELVMKYWAKTTWKAGIEETFFNKFMGTSAQDCIHIKEELSKGPGDSINIPLLMALKGPGVLEDNMMEGNEEALVYRSFDVGISRVRNAVRLEGKFDEHKTQINMRQDAKDSLAAWLADWIDNGIFGVLTGILPDNFTNPNQFPFDLLPPTADRVVFGGGQTQESDITPADKFTPDMIGICKRKAIEDKHKRMRPLRDGGRDLYVMVIDPFQARDLRDDPKWLDAQHYANIRGEKNPIFSGALGMYEGVIIHECTRVPRTATGKSGAKVGHALFLGAQAAVFAQGGAPEWAEDTFDYKNKWGTAFGRMFGLKRSQFKFDGVNETDFGVINVITSSNDDQ